MYILFQSIDLHGAVTRLYGNHHISDLVLKRQGKYGMKNFIVQNIKLPIEASKDDVFAKARQRLLKFFSNESIGTMKIYKSSVDARKKRADSICLFRLCKYSLI